MATKALNIAGTAVQVNVTDAGDVVTISAEPGERTQALLAIIKEKLDESITQHVQSPEGDSLKISMNGTVKRGKPQGTFENIAETVASLSKQFPDAASLDTAIKARAAAENSAALGIAKQRTQGPAAAAETYLASLGIELEPKESEGLHTAIAKQAMAGRDKN